MHLRVGYVDWKFTHHAIQRFHERQLSGAEVADAITNGVPSVAGPDKMVVRNDHMYVVLNPFARVIITVVRTVPMTRRTHPEYHNWRMASQVSGY
jgi:hypothetical protein